MAIVTGLQEYIIYQQTSIIHIQKMSLSHHIFLKRMWIWIPCDVNSSFCDLSDGMEIMNVWQFSDGILRKCCRRSNLSPSI